MQETQKTQVQEDTLEKGVVTQSNIPKGSWSKSLRGRSIVPMSQSSWVAGLGFYSDPFSAKYILLSSLSQK